MYTIKITKCRPPGFAVSSLENTYILDYNNITTIGHNRFCNGLEDAMVWKRKEEANDELEKLCHIRLDIVAAEVIRIDIWGLCKLDRLLEIKRC